MTLPKALLVFFACFSLFACLDDGDKKHKTKDCSVIARCENNPDLSVRLRQVETYYFEKDTDTDSRSADLAQFDYNELDQWVGGVTRRISESDFDYLIQYDASGRMSQSNRRYTDDQGNIADLQIDYHYNNNQLDFSESNTTIKNQGGSTIKTIHEIINYTFNNNLVQTISFNVNDSQSGTSNFQYQMIHNNQLITEIHHNNQSNGRPNYLFKAFSYNDANRVESSQTYKLNSSTNAHELHESIIYEYYLDGPLKSRTSIINTTPKQKIVTRYVWEAGNCATNQTFGDRLFPTPEIPSFPCY